MNHTQLENLLGPVWYDMELCSGWTIRVYVDRGKVEKTSVGRRACIEGLVIRGQVRQLIPTEDQVLFMDVLARSREALEVWPGSAVDNAAWYTMQWRGQFVFWRNLGSLHDSKSWCQVCMPLDTLQDMEVKFEILNRAFERLEKSAQEVKPQ